MKLTGKILLTLAWGAAVLDAPAEIRLFRLSPALYQLSTLGGGKVPVFTRDLSGLAENPSWVHYLTGKSLQAGYGYPRTGGLQAGGLVTIEQLENTFLGLEYNLSQPSSVAERFHCLGLHIGAKSPYVRFGAASRFYYQDSLPRGVPGGFAGINFDLGAEWEPVPGLLLDGAIQSLLPYGSEKGGDTLALGPTFRSGARYFTDPRQTLCVGLDFLFGRLDSSAAWGRYYTDFAVLALAYKRINRGWQLGLGLGGGLLRADSAGYGKVLNLVVSYLPEPARGAWFCEGQPGLMASAGELSPSIRVKAGLNWGGVLDRVRPEARVEADRASFSPDGDNVNDIVNFKLVAQDDPKGKGLKEWALVICHQDSLNRMQVVKSFSGTGLPPATIAWNGRTADKKLVERGELFFQLWAVDRALNSQKTKWQKLTVE